MCRLLETVLYVVCALSSRGFLSRFLTSLFLLGGLLYLYIDTENKITALKMRIPKLIDQVSRTEEQIDEESERFCHTFGPKQLFQLLRDPGFSDLKLPRAEQIIYLNQECEREGR